MALHLIEQGIRWTGLAAMLTALGLVLAGLAQGLCRPVGRTTGQAKKVMRPAVYLLISIGFFGACFLLWHPLPLELSPSLHIATLALGTLLYFPGLALLLWARLTLGQMYNVSSSLGVQLYADHRLITHGPFALVRHPMYLGLQVAAMGGLLLYRTWTLLFLLACSLALIRRARQEEQALAAEFGRQWDDYCQRVPGWIPRLRKNA